MNANAASKILFIDDDKHLTYAVRDFLTYEGFEVHCAASAEEGFRVINKWNPDIIILDISMPGIGGIGFLKRISNDDGSLKYPVLVLTARSVMKEFFDTVAVHGFLAKPCSELDLSRKIRSILETEKSRLRNAAADTQKAAVKRILIGEDDQEMGRLYCKTFKHYGYDVQLAATGPEVLEHAVTMQPDVVIIKEILPNMNGSIVARLIKTMPKTQATQIIVHDETRENAPLRKADAGVDKYLYSSISYELLAAAQSLLDQPDSGKTESA